MSFRVLTLCTGNAARSVMLAHMLATLSEQQGQVWEVRSAGTLAVEGQSISARTLEALESVPDISGRHFRGHRSHQLTDDDLEWADLVVAVEADHVAYVRVRHLSHVPKVVHLGTFCRDAPHGVTVATQIAAVAESPADATLDVADPAGHDQAAYNDSAAQLWELAQHMVQLMEFETTS